MRPELVAALALLPLLAACGGSGAPVKSASAAAPQRPRAHLEGVRPPTRQTPVARVLHLPGLEGVIGATATDLKRQFGAPRLEVIEGDARKLQFTGTACVLDVFLYPPATGRGEPTATYVDARRASDGRDVDRAGCVAALRQP